MICLAAMAMAIKPDEHARSMVWPETVTPSPAASAAARPRLRPAVPPGSDTPITTSSTSSPATPARSTAWRIAWAVRVGDLMLLSAPRVARPIGVRAVETMTASRMKSLRSSVVGLRPRGPFGAGAGSSDQRRPQGDPAGIDGPVAQALGPPVFALPLVTPLPQAAGEEMQHVLVGHPHRAEYLMRDGGAGHGGLARPDFRHRGAEFLLAAVDAGTSEAPGVLGGRGVFGQAGDLVLDGLELADRPAELNPGVAVFHAKREQAVEATGHLGCAQDRHLGQE